MQRVHRLVYHFTIGPLPRGLQIDHRCRNPACANVRHLDVVTCRENLMRGDTPAARNAAKSHCKRGHRLAGANLYRYRDGRRSCRMCQTAHAQRYAAIRAAAVG
jgi:HNH endonuclease